jgi:myo-inositol-1(or 4)-monophosphatase
MTSPDVEPSYAEVARFLVASGRRIAERAGRLPDLGVSKRFLTEEDLRIERELRALVAEHFPGDGFVAEEEHDDPWDGTHWVVDPISGTHTFLAGLAHYGMVATRVVDGEPVFTAIHDPSTGETFTARAGGGAWCTRSTSADPRRLAVTTEPTGPDGPKVLLNLTYSYRDPAEAERVHRALVAFDLYRHTGSFAVAYCHVAAGRFDGVVSLTKDAFTEIAGALVLREAGGVFRSFDGEERVDRDERRFLGGAPWFARQLAAELGLEPYPPG